MISMTEGLSTPYNNSEMRLKKRKIQENQEVKAHRKMQTHKIRQNQLCFQDRTK